VQEDNRAQLSAKPTALQHLDGPRDMASISEERRISILLGAVRQLRKCPRLYRDGHVSGELFRPVEREAPAQSTPFRPPEDTALNANPFRIFTSLLHPSGVAD
jgi:uncharacterized glyoxalase superfamily metalloenzyme YdcJ